MVDQTKVTALVNALIDKFENKVANKKDDISGDFSADNVSYPTVKAVKSYIATMLSGKADTSHSHGSVTADGKIGTASGKIITTGTGGVLQASDSITKSKISDFPTTMTPSSHSHGDLTNDGKLGTAANKPVITGTGGKLAVGSFGTAANTFAEGNHTHSQYLTEHQSLSDIGGEVTVEKLSTAEIGFIATYVVKQNGTQVGSSINIPKDYLVKSATVGTAPAANNPVQGYAKGDKYLDFVINTKDSSGTDEHLYVNVKDLVDTYTAGSGLTLSNNQFSIGTGAVTKTMLATAVQTSLGYADNWNSSAAKGITAADISNWNSAGSSNLTIADVDAEIDAYLDAITTALA